MVVCGVHGAAEGFILYSEIRNFLPQKQGPLFAEVVGEYLKKVESFYFLSPNDVRGRNEGILLKVPVDWFVVSSQKWSEPVTDLSIHHF